MWAELFEYEEAYAAGQDDLKARLFIMAGGHEPDVIEPVKRMVDKLGSRGYPGLEVMAHVFEGEGHASAMAASISRASCVLYNEAWLRG